jgi:hypothetical protein
MSLTQLQNIVNFGVQTANLVYGLLDDSQSGSVSVEGFEKFGEFPEIFYEKELIPDTLAFIATYEAHFLLSDTEVL